jgi:hypothetical protein
MKKQNISFILISTIAAMCGYWYYIGDTQAAQFAGFCMVTLAIIMTKKWG